MAHFYSIGHSNLGQDEFVMGLLSHGITGLADLRQRPYSSYVPHFNKEPLQQHLKAINIAYAWLGDSLGQRFEDQCQTAEGTDLEAFFGHPLMLAGLRRLERGAQHYKLALLCSEGDVIACSRAMLVSEALIRRGHHITHLGTKGELASHDEALARFADKNSINRLSLLADADDWKMLCHRMMTKVDD